MLILWKGLKVTFAYFTLVGLTLISGLLTVLLYERLNGGSGMYKAEAVAVAHPPPAAVKPAPRAAAPKERPKTSALLDAPIIKQYPELPSGCEVTSLTMLLQYAGITKNKIELAAEMKKDETPMRVDDSGSIVSWGNPEVGFVGDITGKTRGFGIYHSALLPLLQKYVQGAVDLTGKPFEAVETQIAAGFPVVVWSTIDYAEPTQWVTWQSPQGTVTTTFAEHAVLLVGYDEANVYVNDPISGKKAASIDKSQFRKTWETMGRQAISYHK